MVDDTCISSERIYAYACCSCSEEQSQQIECHLEHCEACRIQFAQIVDAGAKPSFLRRGQLLNSESQSTLAMTTERIDGESTIAKQSLRVMPHSIAQYRITGYLGGGGMGAVYSAWDELLNRQVALKLLKHHNDKGSRSIRMTQEAAALGRLSHPNIVSLYELLLHESQPVLSMEFVQGLDLAKWLDGRRVDSRAVAELIFKLAGALHYAHSKGVVHRDLKPANVMLEIAPSQSATLDSLPQLVPKITDFGLAKLLDESMMTHTGDMLGTPAYMAPEQAAGKSNSSGPSVDVYALGVMLYEMLTGRPPFIAENTIQTLALIQDATPISPRVHNARVARDLDKICMKCLEKSPADRYASASALSDDLAAFLQGLPVSARPVGQLVKSWRWMLRNRVLSAAILGAAMLLCCVAIGSVIVAFREKELRGKADQFLERAAATERQKSRQLDDALLASSRLFDAFPPGNAEHELVREYLKKIFLNHAIALEQKDQWTAADAKFMDIYCRLMDSKSAERQKLLDQQLIVTDRLCAESPDDESYHRLAGQALLGRAFMSEPPDERMLDRAIEHSEKAMSLAAETADIAAITLYASILRSRSAWCLEHGRCDEAYKYLMSSLPAVSKIVELAPTPNHRIDLADCLLTLACTCCEMRPTMPCQAHIDRATDTLEPLLDKPEYAAQVQTLTDRLRKQRQLAAEVDSK